MPNCLFILIPAAMATLRLITGNYIFSALTSLSCAAVACLFGTSPARWFLTAGLLASVVGDFYLAHKGLYANAYIKGIAWFFAAHALFIGYTARHIRFDAAGAVVLCLMLIGYGFYLSARVLPKTAKAMRLPLALYALISVAGLSCAVMAKGLNLQPLYILGIASIVFSDTMIAEADFVRNTSVSGWILPTYYLCHILITLSAIWG